jgi:hypothetical protein
MKYIFKENNKTQKMEENINSQKLQFSLKNTGKRKNYSSSTLKNRHYIFFNNPYRLAG